MACLGPFSLCFLTYKCEFWRKSDKGKETSIFLMHFQSLGMGRWVIGRISLNLSWQHHTIRQNKRVRTHSWERAKSITLSRRQWIQPIVLQCYCRKCYDGTYAGLCRISKLKFRYIGKFFCFLFRRHLRLRRLSQEGLFTGPILQPNRQCIIKILICECTC